MAEITVTAANFEEEVLNSDKTVLIDFWADWCMPCKMMGPVISEFAEEHPDIKVGKINCDEEVGLATKYGIMSIPSILVFKKGEVVRSVAGYQPINILEKLVE